MEKLGKKKLDMQKLLAPAALVILYIVFSIFGNNFLSLDMVKNILESSYYIGFCGSSCRSSSSSSSTACG